MGNRLWLATDCESEETSPTVFALNCPLVTILGKMISKSDLTMM